MLGLYIFEYIIMKRDRFSGHLGLNYLLKTLVLQILFEKNIFPNHIKGL